MRSLGRVSTRWRSISISVAGPVLITDAVVVGFVKGESRRRNSKSPMKRYSTLLEIAIEIRGRGANAQMQRPTGLLTGSV